MTLYAADGKRVSASAVKGDLKAMPDGAELVLGNWDIEVGEPLTEQQFLSGNVFVKATAGDAAAAAAAIVRQTLPMPMAAPFKAVTAIGQGGAAAAAPLRRPPAGPLHDPNAPNALVLCTPGDARLAAAGCPCQVAVVVDPHLVSRLRPHQVEGVRFMFESVMGMKDPQHRGCILADAMGLGKSVQVIALAWTLLRQSPSASGSAAPVTRRVLIVCPASLVDNWVAEVRKWLGVERCGCTTLRGGGAAAAAHAQEWASPSQNAWPMLVLSYETLRSVAPQLATARVGLLIADEGHRLKNAAGSKTLDALRMVGAPRRVILSGTPVQNNLQELFALVELTTPGLLGDLPTFRRVFEQPIAASRDKHASGDAKRLGAERAQQLSRLLAPFVLRRLGAVNAAYLPPRTDYVVFCAPSETQHSLYTAMLALPEMLATVRGGMGALPPLAAIMLLRRLCNAPAALFNITGGSTDVVSDDEDLTGTAAALAALRPICPPDALSVLDAHVAAGGAADANAAAAPTPELIAAGAALERSSGKMKALAAILRGATTQPLNDRLVVVSGWASTLNLVAALCASLGLTTSRLDGTVAPEARSALVRRFNAGHGGNVFLLSTRAGGVGLNLHGANRLVLYDSDWNPSHDKQALGRVWRDGQTKPVFLYRLLTTGTLEERIFQRQVLKGEVASLIDADNGAAAGGGGGTSAPKSRSRPGGGGGGGGSGRHFTPDELRALFGYRGRDTRCDTADLVTSTTGPLVQEWRDASADVADAPLRGALDSGVVTFVYAAPAMTAAVPIEQEGDEGDVEGGSDALAEWPDEEDQPRKVARHRAVIDDDSEDDDAPPRAREGGK